jgi:cobalt-zinc-cadmium efflux system membrane fusion protein
MEVAETLRIAGRLEVNGYKTARIGAPVTGRISDIRAVLGQEVKQGEMLAEINSQETISAQLSFLKAHSAEQINARAVERAQLLLSADVIGSAELQRRQGELVVAKAEKRAAADQLRVLGLSGRAVEQLETTGKLVASAPISSTQSGTVIERKIAVGQVVQPSDSLFVVSDLRSVWAIAEVPEQDADAVSRGQSVEIVVPALGDEKRAGKIVYVADVVNPETRTVRVGVDLENPGKTLKPAMLIGMLIERKVANRTVVPAAAVVRENDADHLFLQIAPGAVRLVKAKLGPEKNGMRAVLETLPAHQAVVLEGAFHLNNERQKRALEKS